MTFFHHKQIRYLFSLSLIWIPFVLGLGFLVIRPIGLHFSVMPGNYGDTRLINYILEHFFRWASGLEPGYWSAQFFYPFPLALAFSDNLIGAAPLYAFFRWSGLDPQSALQAWYILGFCLNFGAAVFALTRLEFHPLAVGLGSFFFTFGLPMLAQEGHLQLLYRFCVPLACYVLWIYTLRPRLAALALLVFLVAWQMSIGIYMGIFLAFLLAAMGILLPFFHPNRVERTNPVTFWLGKIKISWSQAQNFERLLTVLVIILSTVSMVALFQPYFQITRLYGFTRNWDEVARMLPRPQSYFIADHASYWYAISHSLGGVRMRNEHQLFPGLMIYGLLVTGLVFRFPSKHRRMAFHHLLVLFVLVGLTLLVNDFSLYRAVWMLPGMDSIRSVTRIVLVLMWPLAVFIAYVVDAILRQVRKPGLMIFLSCLIAAGLLFESGSFSYWQKYSKRHAQTRLQEIRSQLSASLPENPILFLAVKEAESEVVSEVDAMLVAQELGWPTLNGYSGNFPPGYSPAVSCIELPRRILNYMKFAGIHDPEFYRDLIARVVPIGFDDCDPSWWEKMPLQSTWPRDSTR